MFSRNKITNSNPLLTKYYEDIDDESAYEKIKAITASKEEEENRIREEQEVKKKELEEAKEKERLEKEEAKKKKEEERKKLAEEKEKEKAKKNDPMYKIGKKVGNQATNTVIRKEVNNLTENRFK